MNIRSLRCGFRSVAMFLIAATATLPIAALAAEDIRTGTWRLVKRQLQDGAALTPPNVGGMFTVLPSGVYHLNVFWKTPDGKPASVSNIIEFKWTETELTATRQFSVLDDGSGKPVLYGAPGETKRVPVKREGSRISYQHPFDPPFVEIDGDTLKATFEGAFVDYWERVN